MSIESLHKKAVKILEQAVGYDENGDQLEGIWKGPFNEQMYYYASMRMLEALEDALTEDGDKATCLSSPIESMMYLRLCDAKRIWFPVMKFKPQVKIPPYTVDFLVEHHNTKVIIECDGHDFHEKTKKQAQHDKKRDRFLTSRGYKLFRYTGSEIYNGTIDIFEDLDSVFEPVLVVRHGAD